MGDRLNPPQLPEGGAVWEGNNVKAHPHALSSSLRPTGRQTDTSSAGSLQQQDNPFLNGPWPFEERVGCRN